VNFNSGGRATLIFLGLVVLLLAAIALYDETISAPPSPGITLSQFQLLGVQAVNSSGTTLVVQFTVKNSTPIGGTLQYSVYNLYADGNYVGRGLINSPVRIPAHGSIDATTDFLLPLVGTLRGSWSYFLDRGDVSWRAVGNATVNESILGTFSVNFDCLSSSQYNSISCSYAAH
jgi:LEA14-like dessication related protein